METRVLISRWFGSEPPTPVYDEASLATVRGLVRTAGTAASLSTDTIERAALIATELARNQLKYARHGYVAVRQADRGASKGLEIVAGDVGPGIAAPAAAIQGRRRTTGSLGAGLETVWGTADEVDIDNRLGEGLCIAARKFDRAPPVRREFAIMSRPYPGEPSSGDDAGVFRIGEWVIAGVADGLGHGREARRAASRAIAVLPRAPSAPMEEMLEAIHEHLAGTRGCAMAVARWQETGGRIESASAGEVYAQLYGGAAAHFFASTPYVLGDASMPKRAIRVETHLLDGVSTLVMFSDGLRSRTSLKNNPNILRHHPVVAAQHLMDGFSRPDDDALVLVVRLAG